MSCLNRYVKQDDSLLKKNYKFKNAWFTFFKRLSKLPFINGLRFMFGKDEKGTVIYASIYGFHISCHGVAKELNDRIPIQYRDTFEWDGIKKQHCANTLFELIEKMILNLQIVIVMVTI